MECVLSMFARGHVAGRQSSSAVRWGRAMFSGLERVRRNNQTL